MFFTIHHNTGMSKRNIRIEVGGYKLIPTDKGHDRIIRRDLYSYYNLKQKITNNRRTSWKTTA